MRTFSTEAQAAMDSGIFEAYIRVGVVDTDPNNFKEWIEPIQYKLTDTELEVVFPIEGAGTYASDSPYIALRRGVYINGIPETTTTTSFFVTSIIKDERFFYYKASILPDHYKNLGADLTYSEVIENIYLDELNPTVKIIEPTYEVPAHAVWGYLFYPSGRNIIFNSLRSLSTILRQKFLIFLRHTENTYSSKTDIFFYQPTETRAVDYEITDLLYKLPTGGRQINKRLLWRDDSASVTIYDPGSGSGEKYPIHNLGYIPTAGTRPTYKSSPPIGGKSSKLSPNLKYETGDYVTINNHTGSFSYRIKVTEIFDANAPMAWYVIVEPIVWFDNTEGGALPSTIEASAPFTPLNTSTFNNNLDSSVNNLQALAEAVDNLEISGYTPPATTAVNDFQVGDGLGGWIKKTLAETKTILGIFADAANDGIYYVRRNLGWTNLKTYTDTLYQPTDTDLTAIAELSPANDDVIQRKSGAWTNRTMSQLLADLNIRFLLPFSSYAALGSPISTSPVFPYAVTLPSFTIYPKQWSQGFVIGATNNSTNYWKIELLYTSGGTTAVAATITTASVGTNTTVVLNTTTFDLSSYNQASHIRFALRFTKVGTPSDISAHGPAVEYGLN